MFFFPFTFLFLVYVSPISFFSFPLFFFSSKFDAIIPLFFWCYCYKPPLSLHFHSCLLSSTRPYWVTGTGRDRNDCSLTDTLLFQAQNHCGERSLLVDISFPLLGKTLARLHNLHTLGLGYTPRGTEHSTVSAQHTVLNTTEPSVPCSSSRWLLSPLSALLFSCWFTSPLTQGSSE